MVQEKDMNIDVVIVTYNRLKKLKKAIQAFEKQTILPGKIVIVNNNSNDGTNEYLKNWNNEETNYEKIILNLEKNIGGAGGFARGIQYLINNKSNWIWVSDDDAYPDKYAIERAVEYLENNDTSKISAICGQVIVNGKTDYEHRRTIKEGKLFLKELRSKEEDYKKDNFIIDSFSYVGTIMNVKKIKEAGITNEKFFIYYDDSDHAARMNRVGKIVCIPNIKIIHDINIANETNQYTWKTYYLFRNRLYFYKFNFKKRYYIIEMLLIYLRIIKKKNKECSKLICTAIKDFKNNKMGINEIYKPGWKIKE